MVLHRITISNQEVQSVANATQQVVIQHCPAPPGIMATLLEWLSAAVGREAFVEQFLLRTGPFSSQFLLLTSPFSSHFLLLHPLSALTVSSSQPLEVMHCSTPNPSAVTFSICTPTLLDAYSLRSSICCLVFSCCCRWLIACCVLQVRIAAASCCLEQAL